MALPTVDQYGAPAYGPIGRPVAGLIFHTPENIDQTLAQAINTAKWQGTSGNVSGGSYHGILGWDSARGPMTDPAAWVMVRSVPWDQCSGGVSTQRDAIWAPDRYPWIKQMVSPAAYADPNKYFHQISLSGKAAWYTANGYPKGLLVCLAQWVRALEQAYDYDAVLTLHRHWQTNRSDPGPLSLPDLVLVEYNRMYGAPEPAPTPPPVPEDTLNAALGRLDARMVNIEATLAEASKQVAATRGSIAWIKKTYGTD